MKRSEMVKYLDEILYDYIGEDVFLGEPTCSSILNDLEKKGMLPPWSEDNKKCMCNIRNNCPGCSPFLYESTWEKE